VCTAKARIAPTAMRKMLTPIPMSRSSPVIWGQGWTPGLS
jgi:hypothetical protein